MTRRLRGAAIMGVGACLPDKIITNHDLEKIVDTSDEWIRTRTGIRQRRKTDAETATSDLALIAAQRALADAGIDSDKVDLVIVATVTPDMLFPATASIVQDKLGASSAAAFDLLAGCSGFIYGLSVGTQFIACGEYEHVLVIGADTLTKITNWEDRSTCVLFGDGAGAVLLGPAQEGEGLLSFYLGSDGSGADVLLQPGGGSRLPDTVETVAQKMNTIHMSGQDVFKFAVKIIGEASLRVLEKCGLKKEDVDFFIPHQANLRIVDAALKRLELPRDKVIVNLDKYGNMSSASIPVALDEAVKTSRIASGDTVLMVAFGAGLTWGAAVCNWV